jgi:hypothetical protein
LPMLEIFPAHKTDYSKRPFLALLRKGQYGHLRQ